MQQPFKWINYLKDFCLLRYVTWRLTIPILPLHSYYYPECVISIFLRNIDVYLLDHMASYLTRLIKRYFSEISLQQFPCIMTTTVVSYIKTFISNCACNQCPFQPENFRYDVLQFKLLALEIPYLLNIAEVIQRECGNLAYADCQIRCGHRMSDISFVRQIAQFKWTR